MALITFLSDFGYQDHYVGAVKAAILSVNPSLRIIDICHDIPSCNVAHASFVLGSVYGQFPKGTIHLVAVGSDTAEDEMSIALQQDGHFFVGPNNGLFSLISDKKPTVIVSLGSKATPSSFVAKSQYAISVAMLASGKSIYDLGQVSQHMYVLRRKEGTVKKKQLHGHVIHVDAVGNLITNLRKEHFQQCLRENNNAGFQISIGREQSRELHTSYDEVDGGECFFMFNDQDLLEIGIRYYSAEKSLGLGYDAPVYIQFD